MANVSKILLAYKGLNIMFDSMNCNFPIFSEVPRSNEVVALRKSVITLEKQQEKSLKMRKL